MDSTLTGRISKYWFHYIITIPAMILIFVFKIIPLLGAFILPFKDYIILKDITGSHWVGFKNISDMFMNFAFRRTLANTLILKLEYIVFTSIIALVIALALGLIGNRFLRKMFSAIFVIPHFIPAAVFCYIIMLLLSPASSPLFDMKAFLLSDTKYFRTVIIAIEVIRNAGIPALIALAACQKVPKGKLLAALKVIAGFSAIQLTTLLTFDFEIMSLMANPLVYEVGDTLETFSFRTGWMNARYTSQSALWLFRFAVQLILTFPIYFLARKIFKTNLFKKDLKENNQKNVSLTAAGITISTLFAAIPLILTFFTFIYPFTLKDGTSLPMLIEKIPGFYGTYIRTFFIIIISVIINTLITVTLAYPLTARKLPGKSIYRIFILILLVMSTGLPPISEFLMFKSMGIFNTIFPYIISGFFTFLNVFVLKSVFNGCYGSLKEEAELNGESEVSQFFKLFIPKTMKVILGLAAIHFITLWNSFTYPLFYGTKGNMTPMLIARRLLVERPSDGIARFTDAGFMQIMAVIALPSIIIFLLTFPFISGKVLASRMRDQ